MYEEKISQKKMVFGSIYIFCFHIKERKDKEEEATQKVQKMVGICESDLWLRYLRKKKVCFSQEKCCIVTIISKWIVETSSIWFCFLKKTFSFHFFGWPRVKEMFQPDYHLPYQEDKRLLMMFQNFYAQKLFGKTKKENFS
jgi:hypothetical protein